MKLTNLTKSGLLFLGLCSLGMSINAEELKLCDFETGVEVTPMFGANASIIQNPLINSVNNTSKVLQISRTGSNWWELTDIPVSFTLNVGETKYLHILANYSSQPDISIRLNATSTDIRPISKYPLNGSWIDMVFEVANSTNESLEVSQIRFLGDLGFQNTPVGFVLSGTQYGFIDEIVLSDSDERRDLDENIAELKDVGFPVAEGQYAVADTDTYMSNLVSIFETKWPGNRTVNLVFHGNEIPTGCFTSPVVNSVQAYPHNTFLNIKSKYPIASVNWITTSKVDENSVQGNSRFESDVLNMRPDVVFIDYALTDRSSSLEDVENAWSEMILKSILNGSKVVLMTPTPDTDEDINSSDAPLAAYATMIRGLAAKYNVGLVDSYDLFKKIAEKGTLDGYMSQSARINQEGHKIVSDDILNWFYQDVETGVVGKLSDKANCMIYPNVITSGELVYCKACNVENISIYNEMGMKVGNAKPSVNDEITTIETSGLISGLYFVVMENENSNIVTSKLFVK